MAAQPAQSPSFFDQGLSTFMQCFKAPAAELFTKHLQSNPQHFECRMYRGICFEFLGEKSKAIADYTGAEAYGTPCEKLVVQGLKLRVQGNERQSTTVLEQATKDYPRDPIAWHFYGTVRYNQGLTDATTVAALKKAVELNYRRSGVTRFFLGKLLAADGEDSGAIEHLRAGIELNPTSTITYIALGDSLLQIGSYEEAKQHYLKAVELNNSQVEANRGLAKIYVHEGNYESAAVQAATSLEARPPSGSRASGNSGKGKRSGRGGGSGAGSGGTGGGDGSGSDDDDPLGTRGKNWAKVKKEALARATHNGIWYYQIEMEGQLKWVSLDLAGSGRLGHAGSGFKVWLDKDSTIEFESSYDKDLKKMEGKTESNVGRIIKKAHMNITDLSNRKKKK